MQNKAELGPDKRIGADTMLFDAVIDILAWIITRGMIVGIIFLVVAYIVLIIGEKRGWWE